MALAGLALTAVLVGCDGSTPSPPSVSEGAVAERPVEDVDSGSHVLTLAFAGDIHFEARLAALLRQPRSALGPIARTLAAADVSMVNLESAITNRGTPDPKELEVPGSRYYFRTSPAALDVLAAAGVDVVGMANNHAADWGPVGFRDTLRAARRSPIPVVGVGRSQQAAFTPYRVSVRGTDVALLAADTSFRESTSALWAAGDATPGVAAARGRRTPALLDAVRSAARQDDVVVVYLHWGLDGQPCPTEQQRTLARALATAGADVVVGSHAHVLMGSGWLGDAYVNYGLGNFLWYHNHRPETGVLRLRIEDGKVVRDDWTSARIRASGRPVPVRGDDRNEAVADWGRLRGCADLAGRPRGADAHKNSVPAYHASVQSIGPALRARMRWSHRPGCPVGLSDLRYLRMTYRGFDGKPHTGEMVVHEDLARSVTRAFRALYDAGWPIQRMRLVDDYRGDDDRSMAANNTSGFNCRRVAGQEHWSAHAHGAAIDLNPVQNPYVTETSVQPPAGRHFAAIDRSRQGAAPAGAIRAGDVVVRAFARIGWEWGGEWSSSKDYQHFAAR